MPERVRWFTDFVAAVCAVDSSTCKYHERIDSPTQGQQKALIRRAREHARSTGHHVSVERGQLAGVQA